MISCIQPSIFSHKEDGIYKTEKRDKKGKIIRRRGAITPLKKTINPDPFISFKF